MRNTNSLWLLLVLSIFAWVPLLTPAYFLEAHDARHSLFYVVEFDQTLRDGYLWPRWSPDFAFGYGYPLFNIYSPLAIYLAALLHLLGVNILTAVKVVYVLATIGSGLAMYGFVRGLFGPAAGLLAGVVYMYAPFHLLEIYVRSAYAEYVALMCLPLSLWAFTELIAQPTLRRFVLAGGSYGLLALVHHTTFFTFTPFLMLYILVLIWDKAQTNYKAWFHLSLINMGAGLFGLCYGGIYLLPLLLEVNYINVSQWTSGSYNFQQHFVYFSQFLSPFWGYGYAGPGPIDGMAYQIGLVVFGFIVLAVPCLVIFAPQNRHRKTSIIFIGASLFSIWLMSPWAAWLWNILPIASLLQFPWRLLIITVLSASIIAGAVVAMLEMREINLIFFCLIMILGSYTYTQPQYTAVPDWATTPLAVINWDSFSVKDRVGMVTYTQEQPPTSPLEEQYRAGQALEAAVILSGSGRLETIRRGGSSAEVKLQANEALTLQFYTYDYPGWQVRLNEQPITHRHEPPYGLITVDIPPGEHVVTLQMGPTWPRLLGRTLTLATLGLLIFSFTPFSKPLNTYLFS